MRVASVAGPPAVVLLSGGLDSSTVLAMAQHEGLACHALTFWYGQRHQVELSAARQIAKRHGVELREMAIDLRAFGGSALTADVPVPKHRDEDQLGTDIPITYVPARNTIFLSFALGLAEVIGARDIFIGANVLDSSGYPDCRPAFLSAFEQAANLGSKLGVEATAGGGRIRIRAPLVDLSKAQIIKAGVALGVDYQLTWSCYDPVVTGAQALACGACDACLLRARGFSEAGVKDPTRYANR